MAGRAEYPFDGILGLAMPGLSQSKDGVAGNDPWYDGKLGLYRRSPCGVMFSQYCWDLLMLCLVPVAKVISFSHSYPFDSFSGLCIIGTICR